MSNDKDPSKSGRQIPIPPVFYSDVTDAPFKNCVMCGKNLLKPGTHYLIEKAMRHDRKNGTTETLFEYAICNDCHQKIAARLSEESKKRLEEYFSKNVFFSLRAFLLPQFATDVNKYIEKCAVKDKPLGECDEYQLCCACVGENLVLSPMPLMLSDAAMEEMQGLLSEKTKEELDRFHDEFLGIPPEWRELLKERAPVFV